jgi:predicted ATP-dependent serine protease
MADILASAEGDPRQRVLILSGLGGIGKTRFLIAFAKTYQKRSTTVFCSNANSEEILKNSFIRMACVIKLDQQKASRQEDEEMVTNESP